MQLLEIGKGRRRYENSLSHRAEIRMLNIVMKHS